MSRTVDTTIEIPDADYAYSYDAFFNTLYQFEKKESGLEAVTVNTIDGYEDKCGTVSYETVFTVLPLSI
ncbi:hypothetical protein [Lacrimispora sp.]|uniref:hypothetical protein n=1 Tax=Lacrimispora sp. TaxID=2719234 RepID=UPI0032E3F52F